MMKQEASFDTHLYLVRHGETDFNRKRMVQGRGIDAPLNAEGQAQAKALASRAKTMPLDAIYASTLLRARETASFVANVHPGVPITFLRDLEEMSWGIYEGQGQSPEMQAAFEKMRAEWSDGNYDYRAEEGESVYEVQARGKKAIEHIVANHNGEHVMVVAHGRFLRILLATLLGDYGLVRMEEIKHANTGLNHLVFSDETYKAHLLNCTSHLQDA